MQIGELARISGVSRDTLRFYEKRGLIRPLRGSNGYRSYPEQTAMIVTYIRMAQRLGFTLAEIADELPEGSDGEISQERLAEVLRGKLEAVDARIADMHVLRSRLAAMIDSVCPLAVSGTPARRK
ncbi:MerR family transcriptional regulator [Hoeflea sp. AS16]|uniref:MerR family transcriptional regulator n=1 Tax=Hoeflea sp. AS16 TaxID=3135779 RepID=UPI003180F341